MIVWMEVLRIFFLCQGMRVTPRQHNALVLLSSNFFRPGNGSNSLLSKCCPKFPKSPAGFAMENQNVQAPGNGCEAPAQGWQAMHSINGFMSDFIQDIFTFGHAVSMYSSRPCGSSKKVWLLPSVLSQIRICRIFLLTIKPFCNYGKDKLNATCSLKYIQSNFM